MDMSIAKRVLKEGMKSDAPHSTFLGIPITEDNFTKQELMALLEHAREAGKIAGRLEILRDPILCGRYAK